MIEFAPTDLERLFWSALALMVAAGLFAPLFRRLGLGTILGYLVAGLAVQVAFAGNFAEHPEDLLHFAEFGVVLFLFVIGLELRPLTLWAMRRDIFGLGLAQLLGCGAVLAVAALLLGLSPTAAVVVGLGLALSSTALVMRTLDERRERSSPHGSKAFAILLFQDLAIVPLLLVVALLAPTGGEAAGLGESAARVAIALAAIGLLVVAGRYLLDPMFDLLARSQMPELMTAGALAVVIAAALLMDLVGMSYAMGAFIAGVMLAESTYRHEVEANVEPFRGLFLGLFFMAVGLSLDLGTVAANWPLIVIAAPLAMALKAVALYVVTRAFAAPHGTAVRVALALPQMGEFGFVLFAAAVTVGVLDPATASILVAIISVSMALSPLTDRLAPILARPGPAETLQEDFTDAAGQTLIIGFGRFGQVVSQPLFAGGTTVTILDNDANRVREASRFGFRVHFGDGTRRDVLRAAGAANADLIVVCIDDQAAVTRIVELAKSQFPAAQVFARSFDRRHSIDLAKAAADFTVRETFESALRMGGQVLTALGTDPAAAARVIEDVRTRDRDRLKQQTEGDIKSGLDRLHVKPVVPEPLLPAPD